MRAIASAAGAAVALLLGDVAHASGDVATLARLRPPVIDGHLAAGEWSGAHRLSLDHQVFPGEGVPATERTEVWLGYDADTLFIAVRAHDAAADGIRGRVVGRDTLAGEDHVRLYLDTFNDRRRAYVFTFNPLGIQADGLYNEGTATGRDFDNNIDWTWDGVLASAGRVDESGFVVEAAIPLRTLRFGAGNAQVWGLHVQRWISRKGERTSWRPVSREASSLLTLMGRLDGLQDLRRARPIDVYPTLIGSAVTTPVSTGAPTTDRDLTPGMTATWLVTPNSSVSATANPDFSQVEADVPQVEVNQRFPLFYPEKRAFFLEGGQYFRSPGSMTFVNTRQIVDPDWGIKFTGKSGGNTIGLMAAADAAPGRGLDPAHPDAGRDALFVIGRYQRDIGRNSTAGAFYTDRQFGREANRVVGVDGQVRFDLQTIGFQAGRSATTSAEGATTTGTSTYVWYDYVGRHWRLFVNDLDVSPGYRTEVGFLRRSGYRASMTNIGYEFQASRPTWWVDVRPFLVARRARTSAGNVDDSIVDPGVDITFARNVTLYTYVSRRWDHFAGVPLRGLTYNATVDVGASKLVTVNSTVRVGRGPFFDPSAPVVGGQFDLSLTVNVSPNDRLAQSMLYLRSRLRDLVTGAELFDQQIVRSRTNYQFTRVHGLRGIVELNTFSRRLGVSILYSVTPRPNTALYVGYDDLFSEHVELPPVQSPNEYRRLRRTVFVKLALGRRFGG